MLVPVFFSICSSFFVTVYVGTFFFFFKQKTAYEITTGDWSSDVCSSDLHRARRDQHLDGRSKRRRRRAEREDRQADAEHAPPPEAVAERGAGDQQHGEGQRVGVHGPLEPGKARVEVLADHRQRRGDDEVVERRHEQRDRGDHERPEGGGALAHCSSQWLVIAHSLSRRKKTSLLPQARL